MLTRREGEEVRFEELSLRIPGDELRMRFHEKTTVLSGIGALERQGLVESLLGALAAGPAQQAELTYIDSQGRRIRIRRDPTGDVTHTFDDGSIAPDFLAVLGLDLNGLRDLAHVRAGDLGLLTTDIGLPDPPELAESRAALADLNEKLESALAARQAVEAMRMELSRIDEGMREADEGRAKRRYARLLTDLERVRAEATAMRTGDAGAASDKRFVEAGRLALRVAERWHATRDVLKQATADFGDRERLDARTLAESEAMPEHAPAGLDALVARLEEAETRRNALSTRLSTLATSRLPEPSHTSVVRLARGDQETVWRTAQKAIDSGLRLERESINLGGLPAEGVSQAVGEELEVAHERLEAAERHAREPAARRVSGDRRRHRGRGDRAHPVPPRGTGCHRRRHRRSRVVDPAAPSPARGGEGTGGGGADPRGRAHLPVVPHAPHRRHHRPGHPRAPRSRRARASGRAGQMARAGRNHRPGRRARDRGRGARLRAGTVVPRRCGGGDRRRAARADAGGRAPRARGARRPDARVRALRRRRPARGRRHGAPPDRDRQHRATAAATGGRGERRAAPARRAHHRPQAARLRGGRHGRPRRRPRARARGGARARAGARSRTRQGRRRARALGARGPGPPGAPPRMGGDRHRVRR